MSPDPQGRSGTFVAVVGPSGAGKDTIIRLAAEALEAQPRIRFARRTVTRSADPASEDHDVLDGETFETLSAKGAFCLSWRAHGLSYGLPQELEAGIGEGDLVVANISRRLIDAAAERFPHVAVALITAPKPVLIERIVRRGREDAEAARQRVERDAPLILPPSITDFCEVDNSGTPADALAQFLSFLTLLKNRTEAAPRTK